MLFASADYLGKSTSASEYLKQNRQDSNDLFGHFASLYVATMIKITKNVLNHGGWLKSRTRCHVMHDGVFDVSPCNPSNFKVIKLGSHRGWCKISAINNCFLLLDLNNSRVKIQGAGKLRSKLLEGFRLTVRRKQTRSIVSSYKSA